MKVEYNDNRRIAFFDGYKFRLDLKTGYYLSSKPTDIGHRERLHCYIWRYHKGPVPDGYHVHHADEDKSHNDIENLRCIPGRLHSKHHSCERAVFEYDAICKNLIDNAVPKSKEWHSSKEGRQWHSKQGKKNMASLKKRLFTCDFCGKSFYSKPTGTHKFCSTNCKSAARRKSGADNETRVCAVCGKPFEVNKYSKSRTCSRECSTKIGWEKRYKTIMRREVRANGI